MPLPKGLKGGLLGVEIPIGTHKKDLYGKKGDKYGTPIA